jgi:hypothetical protein
MAALCVLEGTAERGAVVLAPRWPPALRASRCQAPATQRGPSKALYPVSFPGQLPANAISALNGQASAGSN